MFKNLLLILAIATTLHFQCTDNCLRCVDNVCYYCDLSQGYRLIEGECKIYQQENCYLFDDLGTCLICNEGFHLDSATQRCIKIMQEDLITNCGVYNSPNTCSICKAGFFLNNGTCDQISAPIANCEIENSQQICLQCAPGFIISIDQKSCLSDPQINNCQSYQLIKCDQCQTGFMQVPNFYLSQVFSLVTNTQKTDFLFRQNQIKQGRVNLKGFNNCLKTSIQNCEKYYNFNYCDICFPGFLRTDLGQCIQQPNDMIINCFKYDSLTSCVQCNNGFWLQDSSTCTPIKKVPFCKTYSSQLGQNNCVECMNTHFLIGFNNCVPRTVAIENCYSMNPIEETCVQCNNTYILSDDRLKCLPQISNCTKYQVSSYLSENLNCLKCGIGYYLKKEENFCNKGDIQFCLIYENESNICLNCENKYFLNNGFCEPHDVIPNCQIYHQKLKNVCQDCNYESFKFEKRTDCIQTEEKANCVVYLDDKNCAQCDDKYFLNSEGICELIPASENCVQRIGSQCHKCLSDFILENGICRDPLDYIQNECASYNVDGTVDYERQKCFFCDENRIPINYQDNHLCVEKDIMLYRQNKTVLDTNCLIYDQDQNDKYTCIRCLFPKVLYNGTCIDQCPNDKTLYKQILKNFNKDADRLNESFSIDNVNVCGPLIPNCRIAAPDLYQPFQSKVSYSCVQCADGSIPIIDFDQRSILIQEPDNKDIQFGRSPVSFRPSKNCITVAQQNILGELNLQTNQIDNCDYYVNLGLTIGCTKCSHGYSGVVLDVVNQCEVYINNQYTCSKCKHGFYKSSIYECRPVLTVDQCLYYSQTSNTTKCIECKSGYYVQSDTKCAQRVLSIAVNCTPEKLSDTCKCIDGYFNVNMVGGYTCEAKPLNCITPINQQSCLTCDQTKSFRKSVIQNGQNIFVCQAGGITNCTKYQADQQLCLECNEQAYLKDGVCINHTQLSRCQLRDANNKNTCKQCQTGNVLFQFTSKCLQINKIDYCEEYDSIQTCLKCIEGYRLDNLRARCIKIPDEENCLIQVPLNIQDGNDQNAGFIDIFDARDLTDFIYTCQQCKNGFFLVEQNVTFNTTKQITLNNQTQDHPKKNQVFIVHVCRNYINSFLNSNQCEEHNVTGKTLFTDKPYCKSCKPNYFPELIQDERYICMDIKYAESKSDNPLTNCKRVSKLTAGKYTCDLCDDGYYYDSGDNICKQTCTNQYQLQKLTATALMDFASGNKTCVTNVTVTNCKIYSSSFTGNDSICVQCSDGYVPAYDYVASSLSIFSNFNPFNNVLEKNNMIAQFRTVDKCYSPTTAPPTILGNKGADGLVTNCIKYFNISGQNTIYCMQCKIGYSGILVSATVNAVNYDYIQACVEITGCDLTHPLNDSTRTDGRWVNDRNFNGINNGFWIQELFSCFQCSGNKTPVIHALLDFVNGTMFEAYGIDPAVPATDLIKNAVTKNTQKVIECRQLYNADGTVPQTSSTGFLTGIDVNNGVTLFGNKKGCALGWAKTSGILAVSNMFCVACKAGYRPYYSTAPANNNSWPQITYCEAIQYCNDVESTGKWLNACYDCVHYYDFWSVNGTSGRVVDFGRCVQERTNVTTTNCLAAYHSGPCQICKKGYVKNQSGVCEQITVAQCQTYNLLNNSVISGDTSVRYDTNNSYINNRSMQTFLFHMEFNKGCTVCDSNFLIFPVSATNPDNSFYPYICSNNPFNRLKPVTGVSDIPNCTNYGLVDPLLAQGYPIVNNQSPSLLTCKKCSAQYVLTQDGQCTPRCPADFWVSGSCLNNTPSNLLDCDLANEMNGTTCMKCITGKLNVAGVCVNYDVNSPIKNCSEYKMNDTLVLPYALCNKCLDGYYLSDDSKLCIQIQLENCATWGLDQSRNKVWCLSCKQNYLLIERKNQEQYCYPLTFDQGLPDNQDQCAQWSPSLFVDRKLECTKCKLGTNHYFRIKDQNDIEKKTHCLPFQNNVTDCSSFDVNLNQGAVHPEQVNFPNAVFGTFFPNTFNCLTCVQDNGSDLYKTYWYDQAFAQCKVRTQVTNCKEHHQFKNECKVCEDNFLLRENQCINLRVSDNEEPINKGYVQKCQKMDECDGKVSYQGLHPHLQGLVSCHACSNVAQIPFIGVKMQNDNFLSLQEYGLPVTTGIKFNQQSKNKATECLTPINTSFGATLQDWVFPANCGVGIINTNQIASTVNPFYGVFCGACKPGFKATYVNKLTMQYNIQTCTAITNCESSTWFNYCSQCMPKYTYQYIQKKGVQYDVCLNLDTNPNCYAAEQITENGAVVLKCRFCRIGYILNPDGYCENLLAPRCAQFKFNFRTNYDIEDLNSGLILSGGGFGCQQCDEGFVGLYNKRDNTACTASPYHVDQKLTATSNYIYQCKYYKVTPKGELWCQQCQTDYTLTIRGKCVQNTNVTNCNLALDTNKCRQCNPGYVVVDRQCVQGSIQNCQNYGNNDQSYFQICLNCQNGFYLEDNQCKSGSVQNCEEYEANNVCRKCKNNFVLIYTKNMKNYCYPISETQNCSNVDQEQFREGEFRCNQCSSNKFFLSWNKEAFEFQNTCQRFLGKENCIEYDQERFFYESTFVCTKCDPLYYLDIDNNCVKRTLLLEKCQQYSLKGDKCQACETGFFISTDGLSCVPYPTGIPNCARYHTIDICTDCDPGYYLNKNKCVLLIENQKIDNCDKYLDNGICTKCNTGFIWTQNKCVQVQALNCSSFQNINSCASCLSGFGFQYSEDNKFLNCVTKTKPNCLVSEDWAPFKCIQCENKFYVDSTAEANCVAVVNIIENCQEYVTESICKKCAPGTALTSDKKACLLNVQITSILDPNCSDSKITEKPSCQACKWGHVFTYGLCRACKQNTLADGCLNCDPLDQSKCLLCVSGFYMADNGKCYKNGSKPVDVDPTKPDNGNGGNTDTKNNEVIRRLLIMAFVILGLF